MAEIKAQLVYIHSENSLILETLAQTAEPIMRGYGVCFQHKMCKDEKAPVLGSQFFLAYMIQKDNPDFGRS